MSTDQDFSVFSERDSIQQIYKDLGCPQKFTHENVLYEFRNDCFILTRFPADHPAKVFTIPDGVNEIESDAFSDCAGLTMLTFPESVTYVGDHAFSGDVSMTIRIPGDVDFSAYAFCETGDWHPFDVETDVKLILKRCSKTHAWARILDVSFRFDDGIQTEELITEEIRNGIKRITYHGVSMITGYDGAGDALIIPREIDLNDKMDYIGDPRKHPDVDGHYYDEDKEYRKYGVYYFDMDDYMHYCVPMLAAGIGDHAFADCRTITEIMLPDSMNSIGAKAFASCPSLRRVLIPASVTEIAPDAFANCPHLTLEVEKESYALQYAMENAIDYVIVG